MDLLVLQSYACFLYASATPVILASMTIFNQEVSKASSPKDLGNSALFLLLTFLFIGIPLLLFAGWAVPEILNCSLTNSVFPFKTDSVAIRFTLAAILILKGYVAPIKLPEAKK